MIGRARIACERHYRFRFRRGGYVHFKKLPMKVVQWRTSSHQRVATIGRLWKYCLLPAASESETSDRRSECRRLNQEQNWTTSDTAFRCHHTAFGSPAHNAAARITSGGCRP